VPETAVVLRQRPVNDRRPASRPDSGVGIADLGVAATAVLYAAATAANRDSNQSIHLSSGELLMFDQRTYKYSTLTINRSSRLIHSVIWS